jgi:malonate-semialdehyde dehydrogenase (acetylating)/methylmalonate-semialdehyde dehydrogenase
VSFVPVVLPADPRECENLVAGTFRRGSSEHGRDLSSPYDGRLVGRLRYSTDADVNDAVLAADRAFPEWAALPLRERARVLSRFRALIEHHAAEIANTAAIESGKTVQEARAGLERGLEVFDFALGLPNADTGRTLEVSRGVTCEVRREALGVVAGVTPFNFPAMVPMWMFPIALTVGNAFVLKPSEKVPLTASLLGRLAVDSGLAPGIFSIVHGDRETVNALVEHPLVRAVGFVGSTPAAQNVYVRATSKGKRALCLGGAKNALIVAPDADDALATQAVVDSFTGCAGQRCMAASLMVAVGDAARTIQSVCATAARIELGRDMGALIDTAARERLVAAIDQAEKDGARVVLDGRAAVAPAAYGAGNWLGPTVIDHARPDMQCATKELFGPVLTIVRVDTLEEALALDLTSGFGNATSVFTTSGAVARTVSERSGSGMIGVNVGVPVPRDPFPFGGTRASKLGHGDITGHQGVDFWSNLKKITTKWVRQPDSTWMS